jgi:hypothetical protein
MTGRLLMVGLSHHAAPLDARARVAVTDASWRAHAPANVSTVLLSTCNRVEVYAWIEGRSQVAVRALQRSLAAAAGVPLAELRPYLRTAVGRDALLHLVRVTSGLDSLVVGEEQIRGQVRDALRAAEKWQALPASLRGVFQRAGEAARRVRGTTRLATHPSMAAAGVNVARRALSGGLEGEVAAVLGAGVMARAAAEALLAAGADRVVIGTAAWPDPTPWLDAFGEAAVIALDVRDGRVRSAGWTQDAGLTLDDALARVVAARVLVTAIDRDGTLAGPDLELVARAAQAARVLAAGGVRSPADVDALAAAGAEAAVVGRALLAGDVAA